MTQDAAPIIGLVTVTYSPGPALLGMLDSLGDAYRGQIRVVLADNGSTDGTVEAAAQLPGVRLVRTGGNLGYGGAANVGVRALDPAIDRVVITNPDIVFVSVGGFGSDGNTAQQPGVYRSIDGGST